MLKNHPLHISTVIKRVKELISKKEYLKSDSLEELIGFKPINTHLYTQALTHCSAKSIDSKYSDDNDRLEFLGDSVLSTVISEIIFLRFPKYHEGELTNLKSSIVSRANLNSVALKLEIDKFVIGETRNNNKSINGNALEAIIGAIYLDMGYSVARNFIINKIVSPHIDLEHTSFKCKNYKSQILEWAAKNKRKVDFAIVKVRHVKNVAHFESCLIIDNDIKYHGTGNTKIESEQNASKLAIEELAKISSNKTEQKEKE